MAASSDWTDVGELLDAAAAELQPGELLKSGSFRHALGLLSLSPSCSDLPLALPACSRRCRRCR